MILTVNIGNTHITVGGYDHDTLRFCGRLHSDPAATIDEYAIRLVNAGAERPGAGGLAHPVQCAHPDRGAGVEEHPHYKYLADADG